MNKYLIALDLDYLKSSAQVMMVLEIIGLIIYVVTESLVVTGK